MAKTKRREHPLALLFWSQMGMAYGLPTVLEMIARWKGYPSRAAWVLSVIWPVAMATFAVSILVAEFGGIYGWVIRRTRRVPGIGVGAIYAIFAFLALTLWQQGPRNARIAWADYVVNGTIMGILVLLLGLALELYVAVFVLCQLVALARRWRRITRMAPPQAAE